MAGREAGLIIESLANGWNQNHAPAAGTTCTASVQPASKPARIHLTQLGWSIRNPQATAYTATLSVRDASIGGTVLATWDIIIAAAASLQDTFSLNIQGLKNSPINVDFGTPAASVVQKVSIAGWQDTLGDG